MVLRLEHIHDVRAKGLRGLHHVRAGGIALAGHLECGSGSQDRNAGLEESVDELGGVGEVRLVRRNDVTARIAHFGIVQHGVVQLHGNRADVESASAGRVSARGCRAPSAASSTASAARRLWSGRRRRFERRNSLGRDRPVILAALLNRIHSHAPDVEEEGLAITGRQVEHGPVVRDLVLDGLPVVPQLGNHRHGPIPLRQLFAGHHRDGHGRGTADDLREDADHVVEVCDGAQAAVPPRRVSRSAAHGAAALAFRHQPAVHGRPHQLDSQRDQRIEVVVERVAERRHENHRSGGSGLVVVVHHLRKPLQEKLVVHVGGFRHVGHVEVAVVVVPDVLGVEPRQPAHGAFERLLQRRIQLLRPAHVPVGDQFLPVRVGQHAQ